MSTDTDRADGMPVYSGLWWKLALPQSILLTQSSLVIVMVILAASRSTPGAYVGPSEVLAGVIAGWVLWTFFEYCFHRWLLHHMRTRPLRILFWNLLHREHHLYRRMRDPDHHGVHLAITLPITSLLCFGVLKESRQAAAPAILAGWLLGYCVYEALHWLFHANRPNRALLSVRVVARLRDAHEIHHLVNASRHYGFVSMFWDRVFGTSLPSQGDSDIIPAHDHRNPSPS